MYINVVMWKNADERRLQNDDNGKNFDGWNWNFVFDSCVLGIHEAEIK